MRGIFTLNSIKSELETAGQRTKGAHSPTVTNPIQQDNYDDDSLASVDNKHDIIDGDT